jgi:3-methyl-2-oxobutanoate hydroxymethyltransferase
MKKAGEKIVMVTAYDYPSGKYAQNANVDMILVGDTLGMVVQGDDDTLSVTVDDIIYHCKAARKGAPETFIVADMPFMSFHLSEVETKQNAARMIIEGKANAVKLEGGSKSRLEAIAAISDCEIPVVAHLGLTPQSVHSIGGYKVQGKGPVEYNKILEQAIKVEKAGAFMLVLESIPEKLGQEISEKISIPTIGIGAGRYCDGQVLVYHDILGMADLKPKFVNQYSNLSETIVVSIAQYTKDVKSKEFPAVENIYFPIDEK